MDTAPLLALDWPRLAVLALHFGLLSLVSIGGAIATAGEMQRLLVHERGWMSPGDFSASIAIAQAAPGPNVLFVGVLGLNVAGLAGAATALLATLLPSCLLSWSLARAIHRHRATRSVRAFQQGLAPLALGLLASTGLLLLQPVFTQPPAQAMVLLLLALATVLALVRWKLSPVWLIGLGALVGGAMGALGHWPA